MPLGRIASIPLRASAVRLAWAIKATIRWPLSYQAKEGVNVRRLNRKNTEAKVAVKESGEIGIKRCCTPTKSCCRDPAYHRPITHPHKDWTDQSLHDLHQSAGSGYPLVANLLLPGF